MRRFGILFRESSTQNLDSRKGTQVYTMMNRSGAWKLHAAGEWRRFVYCRRSQEPSRRNLSPAQLWSNFCKICRQRPWTGFAFV